MKRLIYIFILISLTKFSFSQNYCSVVPDSIIKNFMIWEIENSEKYSNDKKFGKKRVNKNIIHWENAQIDHILSVVNAPNSFDNQFHLMINQDKNYSSNNNNRLKNIPELLNNIDIEYLKEQFENIIRDKTWDFNSKKISFQNNPRNKYYTYSIPLFNKSHTMAILYKEFFCGSVCAYGDLNIYLKENGKWRLYKSISCWIS